MTDHLWVQPREAGDVAICSRCTALPSSPAASQPCRGQPPASTDHVLGTLTAGEDIPAWSVVVVDKATGKLRRYDPPGSRPTPSGPRPASASEETER